MIAGHYFVRSVSVLALLVAPALAQEPLPGWEGLNTSDLSTVYVLDDMEVETTGTLIRVDPESLTLLVNGMERRYEVAEVKRLQKRGDSLKNGATIGAFVGVVMGALIGGFSDCSGGGSSCTGELVTAIVVSTGVYAAVGTGIDALITGRTTLYEAPAGSAFRNVGPPGTRQTPRGGSLLKLSFRW